MNMFGKKLQILTKEVRVAGDLHFIQIIWMSVSLEFSYYKTLSRPKALFLFILFLSEGEIIPGPTQEVYVCNITPPSPYLSNLNN